MTTEDASDKWFVLTSADAVAGRALSTEEIVDAHRRGAIRDRTVIYHRFSGRRDAITVKELVDRANAKK